MKPPNIELSSCLSVQWGVSPVVVLDGGWNFHRGGRNLETEHVRLIHVGATWPLPNEAHRTSNGHKL
jgi:hypothetical protein